MADRESKSMKRPTALGRAARADETRFYRRSNDSKSVVWRNPGLTWALGTSHFFVGALWLTICIAFFVTIFGGATISSPNKQAMLPMLIIAAAAAGQVWGGWGLLRRKPWSRWFAFVSRA